jgi:predicted Fe-Mo cluster-binding NifX family protein
MPTFGNRVSPRFDCANTIVVTTVRGKEIAARRELDAKGWTPHERVARLIALQADVVVCGGIDHWSAAGLRDAGITLYSGVTGTSEENLEALLKGQLTSRHAAEPASAEQDPDRSPAVS